MYTIIYKRFKDLTQWYTSLIISAYFNYGMNCDADVRGFEVTILNLILLRY